jgi:hypothetical protein
MLKYFPMLRNNLPESLLAGLAVVLALAYGSLAVLALDSARSGGADFYVSQANPWQGAGQEATPAERRLALRVHPSAMP